MSTYAAHLPSSNALWFKRGAGLLVSALALIGVALGAVMFRGGDPLTSSSSSTGEHHVVGEDVATSFGVIAVEHAQAISGLSDQDVTGAHGVEGFVAAGTIGIQVGATITNLTDEVLSYRADQFELLDGTGAVIPLTDAPSLPGELQPNAAIDFTLDFTASTDARPFTVRYIDPATKAELLIELGAVGCTVESGTGRPLESAEGCSQLPAATHTEDH
jgi:hypothetical protein